MGGSGAEVDRSTSDWKIAGSIPSQPCVKEALGKTLNAEFHLVMIGWCQCYAAFSTQFAQHVSVSFAAGHLSKNVFINYSLDMSVGGATT